MSLWEPTDPGWIPLTSGACIRKHRNDQLNLKVTRRFCLELFAEDPWAASVWCLGPGRDSVLWVDVMIQM